MVPAGVWPVRWIYWKVSDSSGSGGLGKAWLDQVTFTPTGPRVTVLSWSSNTLRLSVPTTTGKSYGLEYKASLSEPEWTRLPAASGTDGQLILTDPAAPGSQRFYRVREE